MMVARPKVQACDGTCKSKRSTMDINESVRDGVRRPSFLRSLACTTAVQCLQGAAVAGAAAAPSAAFKWGVTFLLHSAMCVM
jgi:hypothetical protein